jgi:hypothetical protein
MILNWKRYKHQLVVFPNLSANLTLLELYEPLSHTHHKSYTKLMRTKDKALRWGYFQNKGLRQGDSLGPLFWECPHPKPLPILKHKAKFIMNQTYEDQKDMNGSVVMPTPQ